MLCIYNYLSLFVYESHKQLANIDRVYAENLIFSADAAEVIRRSRHSLKLFEDTRRGVDGQLRYFSDTVIAGHRRKFIEGVRFRWAQFLATDLGIYTYSQIPIATTHSATFTVGATPDELFGEGGGLRQRQIAEEYGRYFGALTGGTITEAASFVTQMQSARLSDKDVRADRVYAKSFNGESTPALNGLLSVFQSLLNTVNTLLPLDTSPESWQTTLKTRLLTVYQVVNSLAILKEGSMALCHESVACIDSILRHPMAQRIIDPALKPFRNTLMHYGPDTRIDLSRLSLDRPLYGLIELCFNADSALFEHDLALLVRQVATIMNDWATMNTH
jgi:hypothetical protein